MWARENRIHPTTSAVPGPRDPGLTPYVIPISRAIHEARHPLVTFVTSSQTGKTELLLDCMGARLDQAPVPIIYAGPSRDFVTDQFEPRVKSLFEEAETLAKKVVGGRNEKKLLKRVAGVVLRLAYAGSSAALKSDAFGLAFADEYDEFAANIKGQGDPLGLLQARGETYPDFVTAVTSTPGQGLIEVEICPESGLIFWKVSEPHDVQSPTWRLWQRGTRFHWSWPCPQCTEFFVPRLAQLQWPKGASPTEARKKAFLECPRCGYPIEDDEKPEMNRRGVFVAPGQRVIPSGEVIGEPATASPLTYWVSGLCSPFKTFGHRAERYVEVEATGDDNQIQTVVNSVFGECYSFKGDGEALEWQQVKAREQPYSRGEVPLSAVLLTAGVDVGLRRFHYVIRGWGARGSSWLIDRDVIWGNTREDEIWDRLMLALMQEFDGLTVRSAFVDSGYRPDKPMAGDPHRVYEFARLNSWLVQPTKGHDTRQTPLHVTKVDFDDKKTRSRRSVDLVHLDTDFFKSYVQGSLRRPADQLGGAFLFQDIDEDYCRQMVSEVRTVQENGRPKWVKRSSENHYWDSECMAFAAAYRLGVLKFPEGTRRVSTVGGKPEESAGLNLREKMAAKVARLKR